MTRQITVAELGLSEAGYKMLGWLGSLAESGFGLFAISILTGAYVGIPDRLAGLSGDHGSANPYSTAAMACVAVGLIVLCTRDIGRFLFVVRRGFAVNLFLLFAFASTAWSFDPSITIRRDVTLLTSVGFAYYAVARFPLEQVIRLLARAFVTAAIASAGVAVAMPRIGVMTGTLAGDWNGVFSHKSVAGEVMALGCLCCGWLLVHDADRRWRAGAGFAICLAVAVMSRSSTSLISILGMGAIGAALPLARARGVLLLWVGFAAIILVTLVGLVLPFLWTDIAQALGKDPDITGRIPLWGQLLRLDAAHPLGYGYGAFWLQWNPDAQYIWKALKWDAVGSHNAWIEMMTQLGIPGALLAACVHIATIRRSLLAVRHRIAPWASFTAVYAISFIIICAVEGGLFQAGDVNCMMLALAYAALRAAPATLPMKVFPRLKPMGPGHLKTEPDRLKPAE